MSRKSLFKFSPNLPESSTDLSNYVALTVEIVKRPVNYNLEIYVNSNGTVPDPDNSQFDFKISEYEGYLYLGEGLTGFTNNGTYIVLLRAVKMAES